MTATTTKTVTITLEGKEVDDLAIACRNTKHLLMRQHDETASVMSCYKDAAMILEKLQILIEAQR